MGRIYAFIKKEIALVISFAAAAATAFIVKPDASYIGYIDFKVLAVLFCLMAVISGFGSLRLFEALSQVLLRRTHRLRMVALILVLLCFFTSMLATNDVALIAFIPFTLMMFSSPGMEKELIYIITLQTVAANLGSMLTPVGNPQNLFLYAAYDIPAVEFFSLTLPATALSLCLLVPAVFLLPRRSMAVSFETEVTIQYTPGFFAYLALLALCLLSVFSLVNYILTFAVIVLFMLIFDRKRFKAVDYPLLATFVCFFLFTGNIARIESVSAFLKNMIAGRELAASVLASQVISNVPAAVLLS